jgi:hypothetical protein
MVASENENFDHNPESLNNAQSLNFWLLTENHETSNVTTKTKHEEIMIKVLFTLLIMPIMANAQTIKEEESDFWYKCSQDAECIVVSGICHSPTAINRKYEKEAMAYYNWRASTDKCSISKKEKRTKSTRCQSNICTIVN